VEQVETVRWEEIGSRLPQVNPDGAVTFRKVVRRRTTSP
jgi:hypothetical protein